MFNKAGGSILAAGALSVTLAMSAPALADDSDAFADFGVTVQAETLDQTRGMAVPEDIDLEKIFSAVSEDNKAYGNGVRTNNIAVGDGATAFNDSSGIATVIQNAGDNVIIQTATIVGVTYFDTPE